MNICRLSQAHTYFKYHYFLYKSFKIGMGEYKSKSLSHTFSGKWKKINSGFGAMDMFPEAQINFSKSIFSIYF